MIRSKHSIVVVSVLATSAMLLAGLAGCGKKERSNATSTTFITSETLIRGDISGALTDPRAEYARIARGDLDNLDRRIALLEARPAGASYAEKAKTQGDLREVRSKLRDLRLRVEAVPTMQTAVFHTEQPHLQADWDKLVDRVERIGERLTDKP